MNLLVIIAILLALTGFKPAGGNGGNGGNGDKGQVTQGYYTPSQGSRKRKMDTNANLGGWSNSFQPQWFLDIPAHQYFRADLYVPDRPWADRKDIVFLKGGGTHGINHWAMTIEDYNPLNYTTENLT